MKYTLGAAKGGIEWIQYFVKMKPDLTKTAPKTNFILFLCTQVRQISCSVTHLSWWLFVGTIYECKTWTELHHMRPIRWNAGRKPLLQASSNYISKCNSWEESISRASRKVFSWINLGVSKQYLYSYHLGLEDFQEDSNPFFLKLSQLPPQQHKKPERIFIS